MKTTLLMTTYNWPQALGMVLASVSRQTVLPDEIVIADDGSTEETKMLIEHFAANFPHPVIHVWQKDLGFRKTAILNKAIAKATGDYIIQIDGDVVLNSHFIADHIEMAQEGSFVCGSRVKISQKETMSILANNKFVIKPWNMPISFVCNSFRSRLLRNYFAFRYARRLAHLRGCNMAFWKSDLIRVNGYNEDLTQWGHEDTEIAYRLYYSGVQKKALKMGGIVYHLYHKESSRANEETHNIALEKVEKEHITRCNNRIDKYL